MTSIRVICRLRPENSIEKESGSYQCVTFTETSINLKLDRSDENHSFTFDKVSGPESPQSLVFEHAARPVVQGVLDGYNGTIFAYGQTGSGKTYTMEGVIIDPERKGIIPRMMESLFEGLVYACESTEFTLRVSFLEIYLERIHDLLDCSKSNLQVKEDRTKGIYVQNSTEVFVSSPSEMMKVMLAGSSNRSIAATRMNERSSRSHSIFCVNVEQKDSLGNKKTGRLYFVDLAGSESVGKTNVSGQQLKEAQMINKSLSALGNVINALSEKGCNYVPYRDSKLTRILQESIGGNSQTSLIIACSMSSYNDKETLGTLRFGQRAKNIQNKPIVNQEKSSKELQKIIEHLQTEVKKQAAVISKLQVFAETTELVGKDEAEGLKNSSFVAETHEKKQEKDSEYALALLKQQIELVKAHEELQVITAEKKEIENELLFRTKDLNEAEFQLFETQQHLFQEREGFQKTAEDLQRQIEKSSADLQKANLTIFKTTEVCAKIRSDLEVMLNEVLKEEQWSIGITKSLKNAIFSLGSITASPGSPTPDSKTLNLDTQKKSKELEEIKSFLESQTAELESARSQFDLLADQLNTKLLKIEEEKASEIRYKDLQILDLQESLKQEKAKTEDLKIFQNSLTSNDLKNRLEELTQERQNLFKEIGTVRKELNEKEELLHSALLKNKRLEKQIFIQAQNKPFFSQIFSPNEDVQARAAVAKPIRGGGGNFSNFQKNNQIYSPSSASLVKRKSFEKITNQGSGIQSKIKDIFGGLLG